MVSGGHGWSLVRRWRMGELFKKGGTLEDVAERRVVAALVAEEIERMIANLGESGKKIEEVVATRSKEQVQNFEVVVRFAKK